MASDPLRSRGRHGPIFAGAGVLVGIGVGALLWNAYIGSGVADGTDVRPTALAAGEAYSPDSPGTSDNESTGEREWLANALQYLNEVGFSAESIEQLAATLPAARAQALRVIAIEGLAERDIRAAIEYALSFDSQTAQVASLRRVAEIAAGSDPQFALDSAELIANGSLRAAFIEQILNAWSALDPAAVLAYLELDGTSGSPVTAETLSTLASVEPERLLALFDQLAFDASTNAERAALIDALLASDPGILYTFVDSQRFGLGVGVFSEYEAVLHEIAERHIRLDAREALRHLLSVRAPMVIAVHEALLAVPDESFETDFRAALDRSLEMLATGEEPYTSGGRLGWLFRSAFQRGLPDVGAMLDAIANHPAARVRNQIGLGIDGDFGVVAIWAEYDAENAIAWTMRNTSRVSPPVIEQLGRRYAGESPDLAAARRTLYELPENLRGYWMAGVAEGLASSNLDAALAWLEPARGTPVYATVMDGVLRNAVATDPVGLARIIDNRSEPPGAALVVTVATEWGSREPATAGDWLAASRNIDDETRAVAIRQLVLDWAEDDPGGALAWTQRLATGELRDAALGAVVETAAAAGSLEPRLLAGFSSESSRTEAIIGAMYALRRLYPELGQSLIDQYIRDPESRADAEDILEGRVPFRFPRSIDGVQIR